MDIKRITSALLGFPLVLIILIFGNNYIVDICLAGIAMLSMQEYFNAVSKDASIRAFHEHTGVPASSESSFLTFTPRPAAH